MCKAEEMARRVEAMRRKKMTQEEIDSALMEYITNLELQRDQLLSALEKAAESSGFRIAEDFRRGVVVYWPENDPALIARNALLAIKGEK